MKHLCYFEWDEKVCKEISHRFLQKDKVFVVSRLPPLCKDACRWIPLTGEFQLASFHHLQKAAYQLARLVGFVDCELITQNPDSEEFQFFSRQFFQEKQRFELCLSDAADFGVQVLKNTLGHRPKTLRSALSLEGMFQKIPAVIVGAGPSLEKHHDFLASLEHRALIFAGGHAIDLCPCRPHFTAAIDPTYERKSHWDVPFCFQSRATPQTSKDTHALWVPDSHFSFLNWIVGGTKETFDGGWTVSTMMMQLALLWGCNPIVFVGIDLLDQNQKTRKDWQMAKIWIEHQAKQSRDREWVNLGSSGVVFEEPIIQRRAEELVFVEQGNLKAKVATILEATELMKQQPKNWELWKEGMQKESDPIIESLLLNPLWDLWSPLIEREIDDLVLAGDIEMTMALQKKLFCQKILQEHNAQFLF